MTTKQNLAQHIRQMAQEHGLDAAMVEQHVCERATREVAEVAGNDLTLETFIQDDSLAIYLVVVVTDPVTDPNTQVPPGLTRELLDPAAQVGDDYLLQIFWGDAEKHMIEQRRQLEELAPVLARFQGPTLQALAQRLAPARLFDGLPALTRNEPDAR